MRIIRKSWTILAVSIFPFTGLVYTNSSLAVQVQKDSVVTVVAEANGLPRVSPDPGPGQGTYWLVMNEGSFLLPMPFRPDDLKNAPAFLLGEDGSFLLDATGSILPQPTKRQAAHGVTSADLVKAQAQAIQDLINQIEEARLNTELGALPGVKSGMQRMAMGAMGMGYGVDDLWLEVLRADLTNHFADLRLHGTVDTNTYQLLYTNNLAVPGDQWTLDYPRYGDTGTNQTDYLNFFVGTNAQMFFRAHQADPIVSIAVSVPDAIEPNTGIGDPGQPGIFYVSAYPLTNDLMAYYRVSGTASNGVDYTNLSGTVTVPLSTGVAEIDVAPIQDNLAEGSETVTLTLMQTNSYLIDPNNNAATVQIWDAANTVGLYVLHPNAYEPNGPPGIPALATSFFAYREDRRSAYTNDLTVWYQITGTASNGVDYSFLSGSFTFLAGILETNVDVTPLADTVIEGPEKVTLTLMPTNSYLIFTNAASVTATIWDSSTTVSIAPGTNNVAIEPNGPPGMPAQMGSFRVSRTDTGRLAAQYPEMNVYYRLSGTASNGLDYTLSGTLYFATNILSTNLDVVPLADSIIEGSETVIVTLIPTNGYYVNTNSALATISIIDSTTTNSVSVVAPGIAIEQDGPPGVAAQTASFKISRTDSRLKYPDMDVYYRLSGTASNGFDYALSGVLHFATNIISTNLDVVPFADNIIEGPETVTVTLIATNGYCVNTNSASATLTIIDSSTTNSISTVASGISIEQDGPPGVAAQIASFKISRIDGRSKYPETDVYYRMSGTASNGYDYNLSGVLHFATNIISTNLNLVPFADNILEGAETVVATLIQTNGYYVNPGSNSSTLTIVDTSTTVSILAGTNAIEPFPDGVVPFQVGNFVVSRIDTRNIFTNLTVFYQISGTASNGIDYTNLSGTVTFAPNRTITNIYVKPLADFFVEGKETVTLTLLATNGYYVGTNATAATISILDVTNIFTPVFFAPVFNLPWPIGIDYHAPSNYLVVSYNFSTGNPYNFAAIYNNTVVNSNGVIINTAGTNWSGVQGISDEVKLATVKATVGGFTNGDMFYSSGNTIGWLSADSTRFNINWCTLTNGVVANALPVRGSLYVDETGTFSNNLIVVTSPGIGVGGNKGVWRVDALGHPTLLATLNTPHLEGVITLTNDAQKWGPWAGKIITGDEDNNPPLIYTIDTNGSVVPFITTNLISGGIHPEDFDIIPPNQDLYACDPTGGQIVKLSFDYLTNNVGDLLITDAGEFDIPNSGKLFIVHWNSATTNFLTQEIVYTRPNGSVAQLEHVTFAPLKLLPTP